MCHDAPVGPRVLAFGEIAIVVDGVRTPITRRRERGVLSVIMAANGGRVPPDRIAEEVWGDDVTERTLTSVQVSISRLRRLLDAGRPAGTGGSTIVLTPAGYALDADAAEVDTWAFEAAARNALATDAPGARLVSADAALALWGGTPYPAAEGHTVRVAADRLEELRLALQEQRISALLDLGRPQDAQRAAAEVTALQPYRERLWVLLALAQYRCSRQADALATLRRLRERLAEDLGVDPSEEVRRLEQQVLQQDPALAVPATGSPEAPRATTRPRGEVTVGREGTLSTAEAFLQRAATGRATEFLLVAGEPGIGKSRLVRDLASVAEGLGLGVLVGRCHDGEDVPALWPWLNVVRELVGASPTDHPQDDRLAPLLDRTPRDVGAGAGLRMFDAVVDLVTRAGAERPLLLVLEDVHWADPTSLHLLRHLAETSPQVPLAVVVTRRTTGAGMNEHLVDTMAALARAGADRLRLDGLDTSAVGLLVDTVVGADAGSHLVDHVASVTGGNPFFVLQYARLLAGMTDLASLRPDDLPILDVLRQQVDRLPEDGARLLGAAAVVSLAVEPELVSELSGLDLDRCLDLLDLAVEAGLVEEGAGGFAFVHTLAREALRSRLSAARRMRLHDRAGVILERVRGEDADAAAAIAHHAHRAAPLGADRARRATTWLARAAEIAASRSAHHEALELWDLALENCPARSVEAAAAHRGRAAALLRLGRTPDAREAVGVAAHLSRELERWDLVADAAAALGGAGVWSWREHGQLDQPFIDVLTEAVDHLDGAARARVLSTLQIEHYYGARGDIVQEYGEASVRLARETGDPRLLDEMLMVRVVGLMGSGDVDRRLELVEELVARHPRGEIEPAALFYLGLLQYECLRVDEADAAMARCARAAEDLRHSGVDIPLAWWRWARAQDLDAPDARALADEALELHRRAGFVAARELECLHAVHTRPDGAPVPEAAVERSADGSAALRAAVAWALAEQGDHAGALALLGAPAPVEEVTYSTSAGRSLRAGVLARVGELDLLRDELPLLVPHLGRPAMYGSIYHYGAVDHFYAMGLEALGDPAAPAYAARAVELNERLQCRPWERRSRDLVRRIAEAGSVR
jgi:DNA-binding SARP family transcriptional activator/tetratricopeptide (TPR) repeat protein